MSQEYTPIQYSEAIDPALMPTFIAQAKKVIALLADMEAGFRATLKASKINASPNNFQDYKQQAEDIKKADNAFKGLNETQKKSKTLTDALTVAEQKLRLEKTNTNRETKVEAQLLVAQKGSYNDLTAQLAKLDIAYKNINLSSKNLTDQEKNIINSRAKMKQQLTDLDRTQNVYTRNVGNYTGTLVKLGRGFGGLAELIGRAGTALGIDTTLFEGLDSAGKSLIKTSKELSHTTELSEAAHKGEAVALGEEKIAEEENAVAKMASLGVIGLVIAAVAGLAAGIYYLVSAQEELFQETLKDTKAQNANTDAIRKNVIARAELDKKLIETKQKTLVTSGKLGEAEADRDKLLMQFNIDRAKLESDKLKQIDDERAYYMEQHYLGVRNATKYHEDKLGFIEQNFNSHLKELTRQYYADKEQLDLDAQLKQAEELDSHFTELDHKEKTHYKKELKDFEAHLVIMDEMKLKHQDTHDNYDLSGLDIQPGLEYQKRLAALKEQDDAKKQAEALKKIRVDEQLKTADEITTAIEKGLDRRNEAEMDALKIQGDQIESELGVQESLFKDGLDNTLAYDEKAKAENTEKELAQSRKAAKEKKALELSHTYISFLQSFLKDGSNPESAAVKALASTLVSEGIADAIAGSAFDGVEDTGAKGTMDDKGGKLWIVHPNERIVPKAINDKLQGISNEDLGNMFDNDFNALYRPNFLASIPNDSIGGKGNVDMGTLMELNGKMIRDGIEKGFSKIQITNYDLNVYGKIVENKTSNGISKTYIHQSDVFK